MQEQTREPTTEQDDQLFHIRRSVRYHQHRVRFYDWLNKWITILTVVFGVSAFGAIVGNHSTASAFIVAAISALGIIDLVVGTAHQARVHNNLASRFIDLERTMLMEGKAKLSEIIDSQLVIEKEEPPILKVLDVICHNEVMRSMGYPRAELAKIGWFQRLVSDLFDFRPDTLSSSD